MQGFVTYSSNKNIIEINFKFHKCNCSKTKSNENLTKPTNQNDKMDDEVINETKNIINLNKDKINNLVNNLNINLCTKCNLTLGVKNILNQILLNNTDDKVNQSSDSKLNTNSTEDNTENGVADEQTEEKSVKFQYTKNYNSDIINVSDVCHLIPKNSKCSKIIVITDDFKKKSLEQNVALTTKNPKSKLYKSLENLEKCTSKFTEKLETGPITPLATKSTPKKYNSNISKSVDNISLTSSDDHLLENIESVELIFISDEYLNRTTKQDVIIVKDKEMKSCFDKQMQSEKKHISNINKKYKKKNYNKNVSDKKLYIISDDYKHKSLLKNNVVIINASSDNKTEHNQNHIKKTLNLNSKKINQKTIATNSNSFLTYEEPWSPDYFENKQFN